MLEVFEGIYTVKESGNDGLQVSTKVIEDLQNNPDLVHVVGKYRMVISRSQLDGNPLWRGTSVLGSKINFHNGTINELGEMIDDSDHLVGTIKADEIRGIHMDESNKILIFNSNRKM